MNYEGSLYGRIGRKYVPLKMHSNHVDELSRNYEALQADWYRFFYSIVFTPPGEVPQTKGPWTDTEVLKAAYQQLKTFHPPATSYLIISSRCGDLHVQEAEEWLHMDQVMMECAREEQEYIDKGVCSGCGACSLAEAETRCKPTPIGDTGDYSCAGEPLWQAQRDAEDQRPTPPVNPVNPVNQP